MIWCFSSPSVSKWILEGFSLTTLNPISSTNVLRVPAGSADNSSVPWKPIIALSSASSCPSTNAKASPCTSLNSNVASSNKPEILVSIPCSFKCASQASIEPLGILNAIRPTCPLPTRPLC